MGPPVRTIAILLLTGLLTACPRADGAGRRTQETTMDPNEGFGQSYSLPSAITPHPDFGRLRLRCDPPDAVVVVNGVTQGRASDLVAPSFLQLEPGPHMVEIRKEGYSTFRAEIVISPEVIKTLAVTLRRLPGLAEEADLGSGR